jgi:hypothetical protein
MHPKKGRSVDTSATQGMARLHTLLHSIWLLACFKGKHREGVCLVILRYK